MDPTGEILQRLLGAALPVCAGINLEYYFSRVDNDRFGCGTKAPHNPTGLLGVMDGGGSDLRTGLPKQMVELHEPMRLLTIVESFPQAIANVLERNRQLHELVHGAWIHLVSLDPESQRFSLWRGEGFEPYEEPLVPPSSAASSQAWYSGHTDFLPPALLDLRAH